MIEQYQKHVLERETQNIPPESLDAEQVDGVIEILCGSDAVNRDLAKELLINRVPPGVDAAAKVKADFLNDIALGKKISPEISKKEAVTLLGTMLGGYNVGYLIDLLDDLDLALVAAEALKKTILIFDAFDAVAAKADINVHAKQVIQSWADAEWFTEKDPLPEQITLCVFKVDGETNTDDLSPAGDAWSRPDIPLHANAMLKSRMDSPLEKIAELKQKGHPLTYVGDVVGTGSSRKSATNSVLWHIGTDIPFVPNKKSGGFCIGGKIAPIFFNTLEDAGALPIECDVSQLNMGDIITIYPYQGKIVNDSTSEQVADFRLKTDVLLDEVKAGGRIPLIVGRSLTNRARQYLGLEPSTEFRSAPVATDTGKGFTLAQKMVGKACGVEGIRPGTYCEPTMTTVGSQDTTGPMTRDELKELACLKFSSDLVMQSFCHTSAYPKSVDVKMHQTMPDFIQSRGGVALRPGDGVIHSWLNRMILPDTVGTGGDSHTRFPMGISFPAGSGLVAFAAAFGKMPLDMPESVLVRFKGEMQPGITLRDLVNAIPYVAIQKGLLTVEKSGKKNVFSGRILEIEGLEDLSVEQAFELSDASAERSAAGCTIKLNKEPIIEFLQSNISLLNWMISQGYQHAETLQKRIDDMQSWIDSPELLEADSDAEYAEVIEIDISEVNEPLLCCPNDPDDIKALSEVATTKIDEVFIGSCMTNIGHYRAAAEIFDGLANLPTRIWISPATRMDEALLIQEGAYSIFGKTGARMEMPGCSLCMGNQARIAPGSTCISTSTRNFPNRIGDGSDVYLGSAELAAVSAILGYIPDFEEYMKYAEKLDGKSRRIYKYLDFSQMEEYKV
ncbi:MAG: bifunctional aconitate hydratase 2/2-methylisocitrate dehydratase [Gammaproteobacteria bacterium]|nr:MAG: bifunctional aconitate hydratase 2/2-methylisocitrate dehydratase [Gammaproteobacteria bacterium]